MRMRAMIEMIKNKTIYFWAGILLFGAIGASVYGFTKITDATNYKMKIPEVRTVELPREEQVIEIPEAVVESNTSKSTNFEKDDDIEDSDDSDKDEKDSREDEGSGE